MSDTRQAVLGRRLFLASGLTVFGRSVAMGANNQHVYRFATAECDVQIGVEFHDRYSSRGFWFHEQLRGSNFCLSLRNDQTRNCLAGFVGSLALVQYKVRPHAGVRPILALREHVRTIDRDARANDRPPFDRRVELDRGIASDLQAFGYEDASASSAPEKLPESATPWYYFRQDLYLDSRENPFLIIHWKHELSAIRMLDMIPGEGTWPVK